MIKPALKIGDVVELHELGPGNERSERLAIFCRIRDGNRAERASVKRILKRENPRLIRDAAIATAAYTGLCIRTGSRELESSINRFCPAVGEENAIESRPLRQLFRERPLKRIVEQVRSMNR